MRRAQSKRKKVIYMKKKKESSIYKKMTPEQLQEFLKFRRKGYIVPAKKGKGSYNRQEQKRNFD